MAFVEKHLKVFSGSINPELGQEIAQELGVELGQVKLEKFANGEIYARYLESIRGCDVYLVQCIAGVPGKDVNDALMELLIMADAAKRASARKVIAVISQYGYGRQERKAASREPITARLVADLLEASGVDHVISMDLHVGQIEAYFDIPFDDLSALPLFADYFREKKLPDLCIVSPDMGRAKVAKKFAEMLNCDVAIMYKTRPGHNIAAITAFIGDVKGKTCIISDDMIDTGGSIAAAAATLKENGAKAVYICATHPIFSGPAYDRLLACQAEEVVVTNTIPVPEEKRGDMIKVVSVAPMFAKAIKCEFEGSSCLEAFGMDFEM